MIQLLGLLLKLMMAAAFLAVSVGILKIIF